VDKNIARFINSNRKHYGFISEKVSGSQVEMTFMTSDVEHGFPRWYLMFGDYAEIIEPEFLKQRVRAILEKTVSNL
jgi:predicted DNA-binding transcriptional regulator YafY